MGMDRHSVMVIHGGGVYGDKEGTKKRWAENYLQLEDKVKNFYENEDYLKSPMSKEKQEYVLSFE